MPETRNKYDPTFVKPDTTLERAVLAVDRDYPFRRLLALAATYSRIAAIEVVKQVLGVVVFTPSKDNGHRKVDPTVANQLTPELLGQIKAQLHSNRHNFLEALEEMCLDEAAHEIIPNQPLTLPTDLLTRPCAHQNGCCQRATAHEVCTEPCDAPCDRVAQGPNPPQQLGEIGEGIVGPASPEGDRSGTSN